MSKEEVSSSNHGFLWCTGRVLRAW